MKAALTARAAGIDHKSMRFVAFEGAATARPRCRAAMSMPA
ncbi:hypothetical protein ACFSYD_04270 [Paracoccus aerius]